MPQIPDHAEFEEVPIFFPFGMLLGHVVCKKGLMVDPTKIVVIVEEVSNSCAQCLGIQDIIESSSSPILRLPRSWRNY